MFKKEFVLRYKLKTDPFLGIKKKISKKMRFFFWSDVERRRSMWIDAWSDVAPALVSLQGLGGSLGIPRRSLGTEGIPPDVAPIQNRCRSIRERRRPASLQALRSVALAFCKKNVELKKKRSFFF